MSILVSVLETELVVIDNVPGCDDVADILISVTWVDTAPVSEVSNIIVGLVVIVTSVDVSATVACSVIWTVPVPEECAVFVDFVVPLSSLSSPPIIPDPDGISIVVDVATVAGVDTSPIVSDESVVESVTVGTDLVVTVNVSGSVVVVVPGVVVVEGE